MGRTSDAGREKLLQVAFDLIWKQSYGSVSVDDICERAEVKKGSFYYFFPSKSDLAVAAYEAHWQDSAVPGMTASSSPLVPPLEPDWRITAAESMTRRRSPIARADASSAALSRRSAAS